MNKHQHYVSMLHLENVYLGKSAEFIKATSCLVAFLPTWFYVTYRSFCLKSVKVENHLLNIHILQIKILTLGQQSRILWMQRRGISITDQSLVSKMGSKVVKAAIKGFKSP